MCTFIALFEGNKHLYILIGHAIYCKYHVLLLEMFSALNPYNNLVFYSFWKGAELFPQRTNFLEKLADKSF
jgi:hypothetical protein